MAISRLTNIRQLLPGARQPEQDERLLQLFWNRAELKKELTRLQDERLKLLEQIRNQETATARAKEHVQVLEEYLGNPEIAVHALVYFQLRAVWRTAGARLGRFAEQLKQQQTDREQRRQVIEFDQTRRRELADFDRRIHDARSRADMLEAQIKLMEAKLTAMRGFWNSFRRRGLAEEIEAERAQWDQAVTLVTDLSDDRTNLEETPPPEFPGISVDGRRVVNTAVIAYAQQLVAALAAGGLAMLAKETTSKRLFDVRYGSPTDCARLMTLLRDVLAMLNDEAENVSGLKERTDAVRAAASYRSDADTVPLTDSIGTLPVPTAPVSGLETANRAGVNVLVDDYWDLYQSLLQ
jgi:predicted  nucleic acid-binding Zn-ribbon protein